MRSSSLTFSLPAIDCLNQQLSMCGPRLAESSPSENFSDTQTLRSIPELLIQKLKTLSSAVSNKSPERV